MAKNTVLVIKKPLKRQFKQCGNEATQDSALLHTKDASSPSNVSYYKSFNKGRNENSPNIFR